MNQPWEGSRRPFHRKRSAGTPRSGASGKGEPEWNDEEDGRWGQTNLDPNPGDGTSCVAVKWKFKRGQLDLKDWWAE